MWFLVSGERQKKKRKKKETSQRKGFDSLPCLRCEVHCLHASDSTPKNKRTDKTLVMCKNSGLSVIDLEGRVRAAQSST